MWVATRLRTDQTGKKKKNLAVTDEKMQVTSRMKFSEINRKEKPHQKLSYFRK